MTLDLPTSSKTSLSLNLISRTTKELCSFCKERPFDLICQCGEKFDFNCIGNHVETLNFERYKVHVAAGKALGELEATKKNFQFDTYRAAVDRWVSHTSFSIRTVRSFTNEKMFFFSFRFRLVNVYKIFKKSLKPLKLD